MSRVQNLRNAVEASPGCSLVGLRTMGSANGDIPVGKIVCGSGWQAARLLLELCNRDAMDPEMRDLAHLLRKKAGGGDRAFAQMIQSFVQDNVVFAREQGEIFQGPAYTLQAGAGDCDDQVRIVYGLAKAGGLPVRLAFLSKPGSMGPSHVLAQIKLPEGWQWAETTLRADLGEHPIDAAKRFGAVREDLDPASLDVSTMGAIGATSHLPDSFFDLLAEWERDTGADAVGALALMFKESGFDPRARNNINCVGLNQFCPGPKTLQNVTGMTPDQYQKVDPTTQLGFAIKFWMQQNKRKPGLIRDGRDLYWANFLPATLRVGAPDSFVIANADSVNATQNPSLRDSDGVVRAGSLRREIEAQKRQGPVIEAVARLNKARKKFGGGVVAAGGMSMAVGLAVVVAMGAGGYLAAQRLKF